MHQAASFVAAIVGDIAPGDGISKEEKNRRETAAMEEIRNVLGGSIGLVLKNHALAMTDIPYF